MRVGELYSVVALVFAKNFCTSPDITDVMKFRKSDKWLVQRDSEQNALGAKHYAKFLSGESVAIISDDYINLSKFLNASYYIDGAGSDLQEFYDSCKFSAKFGNVDSLSNQLLLVASILKNELNEQTNAFLLRFLTGYFLPYATLVSKDIIKNAQSEFYLAMGYFLDDFCMSICDMFSIKQKVDK